MSNDIVFRILAAAVLRTGGELTISYDDINRPMRIGAEDGDNGITLRAALVDESE